MVVKSICFAVSRPGFYFPFCVAPKDYKKWYSQPPVVVVTPPLPRDGGRAQTAIQAHAVYLIELG